MVDEHIYDIVKSYKNKYRKLHNDNTEELFDNLVKKSGVDIQLNKETIKRLNRFIESRDNLKKQIKKYQLLKGFIVVLSIVSFIFSFINFTTIPEANNALVNVLIGIGTLVAAITFIILILKKINPFLKKIKEDKNSIEKEINSLIAEARKQMQPLNSLFTDEQHIELFRKTIPLIHLDNNFNIKRFEYLVERFGLDSRSSANNSTLFVKSGEIKGNPFYIGSDLVTQLGTKTYSGSKTITYRTYTTVNGKRVAVTNTQTLVATVTKPYPYYNEHSYLVYGNDAAPTLTFSRTDSDAENMSQKQIDKEVKHKEKKLRKKSQKAVKKGDNFTVMAHSEFEVLWNATNRNNEVQFRLLFTPLAQQQLLELMKEKEIGYGDNFAFVKNKKINTVIPQHLTRQKMDIRKESYYHYDYEIIKSKFLNLNNEFLKVIYFAFAPILSIPLYQQHVPHEYIYKDLYDGYVSFYEHEMIVNYLGEKNFAHPDSKSRNILKTKLISSANNKDTISVTAFGYDIQKRVDYVTKLGMDGKMHSIPVHWDEYIAVSQQSNVEIDVYDEEEKTDDIRSLIENRFKQLQDRENISKQDLYLIGRYITRIIK